MGAGYLCILLTEHIPSPTLSHRSSFTVLSLFYLLCRSCLNGLKTLLYATYSRPFPSRQTVGPFRKQTCKRGHSFKMQHSVLEGKCVYSGTGAMRVQEATGKRRLRKEAEMWGRESRVLFFILHAVFCKLRATWAHVVYWYVTHCMIECAFAKYQPCILSPWSFFLPLLSSILILKILSDLLRVLSTLLLPPPSTLSFPSHSVKILTGASFSLTNLEVVLDIHTGQKNPANLHGSPWEWLTNLVHRWKLGLSWCLWASCGSEEGWLRAGRIAVAAFQSRGNREWRAAQVPLHRGHCEWH